MTIHCIVKGNRFQAARAAANRGIPFVFDHEHPRFPETYGQVGDQYRTEVTKWFCEAPYDAPMPEGTLLFYSWQF